MIPFLTAQRYSREVTKNSFTSRRDKKELKKIEKVIDKNILRACDQNQFKTNFYFFCLDITMKKRNGVSANY